MDWTLLTLYAILILEYRRKNMAYTSTKRCPKCNTLSIVINSNNPLSSGICCDCLAKAVNIYDLKEANLFCRTFNYPFDPDK
jgi:hypothetical protein